PIVARLTRRDRPSEADRVTVIVDSRGDGRSAYEFSVNAAGVQSDAIRFNDTDIDRDWDESWAADVARTPRGWSAELRIPLRILRFRDGAPQEWGLQVRRYVSKRQETDEWSFIPRAGAGEVSRYGRLGGVDAPPPKTDIELRPFVLGRFDRRDAGADSAAESHRFGGSIGLDAKWHAKRDLTLDLAILPDFAQVEADQLILNLTNEEIRLPEKRPFFFEGRDVFATPMPLLYTRRIGRITPEAPELANNETLAEPMKAATLLGATKLSGRLTERLGVGALSALTNENNAVVRTSGGPKRDRIVEPMTLFQAARLKYELGGNAHVGAFGGAVVRSERSAPCPRGRCTHDAYVGAVDGRWRSPDGDWTATTQLTGTTLRDGPTRMLRDGTTIGSGASGIGNSTRIAKEGGIPWVGELTYDMASRKLDFNDLGYMKRANIHSVSAALERRTLEPWLNTLETHSRLEVYGRTNLDGLVLAHGYQLNTQWKFTNFWEFFVEGHFRGRHFDDREVGDGTALERRELLGLEVELKSDPRRAVSVEIATQTQRIFDGFFTNVSAVGMFRFIPQLEISLEPLVVCAKGEPRFAGRTTENLIFGKLEATELSGTARVTYTFTPRLSLQTYAQMFLASGHYSDFGAFPTARAGRGTVVHRDELTAISAPTTNPDFINAAINANIVLRWEYALGSTIFFVYTRAQSPSIDLGPGDRGHIDAAGLGKAPATDSLLLKLTHFFG
ncbi:MAG: carbohydrate binding family 9 domain-containing protein, partial [Labilithrix sp.]|nr:carbohydrate binding family 9 domain-containing protein [Labilithrix sp.]